MKKFLVTFTLGVTFIFSNLSLAATSTPRLSSSTAVATSTPKASSSTAVATSTSRTSSSPTVTPSTTGTIKSATSTHTHKGEYTGGPYAGWYADESSHYVKCSCGVSMKGIGSTVQGTVSHSWRNNKCGACGYTLIKPSSSTAVTPSTTSSVKSATSTHTHKGEYTGGPYAGWYADESSHYVKCSCGVSMKGIGSTVQGTVSHSWRNNKCGACGYTLIKPSSSTAVITSTPKVTSSTKVTTSTPRPSSSTVATPSTPKPSSSLAEDKCVAKSWSGKYTGWAADSKSHWKICKTCGKEMEVTDHYEGKYNKNKCGACGYTLIKLSSSTKVTTSNTSCKTCVKYNKTITPSCATWKVTGAYNSASHELNLVCENSNKILDTKQEGHKYKDGVCACGMREKAKVIKVSVTTYYACPICNMSHYKDSPCNANYCNICGKYWKDWGWGHQCEPYCKICGHYHSAEKNCDEYDSPVTCTGSVAHEGTTVGVLGDNIEYGSLIIFHPQGSSDQNLKDEIFIAQDTGSKKDASNVKEAGGLSDHIDVYTDQDYDYAMSNPFNFVGEGLGIYEVTVIPPEKGHSDHSTRKVEIKNDDGTTTTYVKCMDCSLSQGKDVYINSYTH